MFRTNIKTSQLLLGARIVLVIALFSVALFEYEHIRHHLQEANEESSSSEDVGFHESVFHSWAPTDTIDTSRIFLFLVEQLYVFPDVALIPEENYLKSDPRAPPASC